MPENKNNCRQTEYKNSRFLIYYSNDIGLIEYS